MVFMNIAMFPPVKEGKDKEFREWFKLSNSVYSKFDGFISRRLLRSEEDGNYATIVEHRNKETFTKMHHSKERDALFEKLLPLFQGRPSPSFYEVVEP